MLSVNALFGSANLWLFVQYLSFTLAYTKLTDSTLRTLPGAGTDFDIKTGALLAPILIPRVPGSQGSIEVQHHLVNFIRTTLPKWDLAFQNSTSTTPTSNGKDLPFINIIATRDPPWTRSGEVSRLTLVAHYDSKLTPKGFIGAIDSAAPCAMIMHAARSIDTALTKKWEAMQAEGLGEGGFGGLEEHKGIQILFLDGEEAFDVWNHEDSVYGARSLAAQWEETLYPAMSTFKSPLSSISLFVLLDLLGSKNPTVPSYFKTTHWAYRNMANLEQQFRDLALFESSPNHPNNVKKRQAKNASATKKQQRSAKPTTLKKRREPSFLFEANKNDGSRWLGGLIEDDHLPFMARGVEVLHLIPSPFPTDVWHKMEDDGEHLDLPTVKDWAQLTTAFAAEWLDLEGFFDSKKVAELGATERDYEKTEL